MPLPVRLTYFRHGETAWSLSGRHTGRTDIPLTPHGEDQARALRARVEATGFLRVLSSPRLRARETCRLAGASDAPEIEPDAAEWDYGEYEGRRTVDIRAQRPGWTIFRDGCPGGESPDAIKLRADRLIARIRTMEGDVALFSHGHFGVVLAARWIGLEVAQAIHFKLDPAGASVLRLDPAEPGAADIALWNESIGERSGGAAPNG
jgi:broad specificity phosphatase PhoE